MGSGLNTATSTTNPANEQWRNGNTDLYLVNLYSNPSNAPNRNGMTDFSLMNLADPGNEPWRNGKTDTYLMNLGWLSDLEARGDFTKAIIGRGLQNLAIPSGTAKGKVLAKTQEYIAKTRNGAGICYAAVADGIETVIGK